MPNTLFIKPLWITSYQNWFIRRGGEGRRGREGGKGGGEGWKGGEWRMERKDEMGGGEGRMGREDGKEG